MTDRERYELTQMADILNGGGWRAADRDEMQERYSLTDEEADFIAEKLASFHR